MVSVDSLVNVFHGVIVGTGLETDAALGALGYPSPVGPVANCWGHSIAVGAVG